MRFLSLPPPPAGPSGRRLFTKNRYTGAPRFNGHWALRGYGNWAVERRADGALLGRAGLWNPEGWPGLELGWKLARHAWGQGYATEAAGAAMDWAWTVLDAPRLISVVHPENAPSVRVAERLGLRPLREETVHGRRAAIFGIERPRTAATAHHVN